MHVIVGLARAAKAGLLGAGSRRRCHHTKATTPLFQGRSGFASADIPRKDIAHEDDGDIRIFALTYAENIVFMRAEFVEARDAKQRNDFSMPAAASAWRRQFRFACDFRHTMLATAAFIHKRTKRWPAHQHAGDGRLPKYNFASERDRRRRGRARSTSRDRSTNTRIDAIRLWRHDSAEN